MSRVAIVRYCGECGSPLDGRARCGDCGHPADPVVHFAADGVTTALASGRATDQTVELGRTSELEAATDPGATPRVRRRGPARVAVSVLVAFGVVLAAFVAVAALDPAGPSPRLSRATPPAAFELPPGLDALVPSSPETPTARVSETEAPAPTGPATTAPPTTVPVTAPPPTTRPPVTTPPVTSAPPPSTAPPAAEPPASEPPVTEPPATTPTTAPPTVGGPPGERATAPSP
jgi:hypothetical protein